jgi:hypothetical protein
MKKGNYKGGVIINEERRNNRNNSQIFSDFVANCLVTEVVSDSSISGILIRLYGCPDYKSPYLSLRNKNAFEPITSCIIKLNVLDDEASDLTYLTDLYQNNYFKKLFNYKQPRLIRRKPEEDTMKGDLEIQTRESFIDEVYYTQDIYEKSLNPEQNNGLYLQPICPSVIMYSFGIEHNDLNAFLNVFRSKVRRNKDNSLELLNNLENMMNDLYKRKKSYKLVFICQEMMEGYKTINYFIEKNDIHLDSYLYLAKFQLIRLGMNMNIIHNDAHRGNVMINPDLDFFHLDKFPMNIVKGYPIIIDFGRAGPIFSGNYKKYKGLDSNEKKFNYLNNFYKRYPHITYEDYNSAMQDAFVKSENNLKILALKMGKSINDLKEEIKGLQPPNIDNLRLNISDLNPLPLEGEMVKETNSDISNVNSSLNMHNDVPATLKIRSTGIPSRNGGGVLNYNFEGLNIKEFIKNASISYALLRKKKTRVIKRKGSIKKRKSRSLKK